MLDGNKLVPFVSSWMILKLIIDGDLSFVYSWVLDFVRTICCQIWIIFTRDGQIGFRFWLQLDRVEELDLILLKTIVKIT